MNTGEVAKLLGVSASTIQRWVKQLELPLERNDRGHYFFNESDIKILKEIQTQIQHGSLIQEISVGQEKKQLKATAIADDKNNWTENLAIKMNYLENKLNDKADSVVSYQLLQHRREIDDLQNQVNVLTEKLQMFEAQTQSAAASDQTLAEINSSKKKKRWFRSIFGF